MPITALDQSERRGKGEDVRLQRRGRRQNGFARSDEAIYDLIRLGAADEAALGGDRLEAGEEAAKGAPEDLRQSRLPVAEKPPQPLSRHRLASLQVDDLSPVVGTLQNAPCFGLRVRPPRAESLPELLVPPPKEGTVRHHGGKRRVFEQMLELCFAQLSRHPGQHADRKPSLCAAPNTEPVLSLSGGLGCR